MKRKWNIAALAVCAAVALTGVFAAAAGSEGDPLVTLSYLQNIFTPKVQTAVDEAVAKDREQIKVDVNATIQEWEVKINEAVENTLNAEKVEEPATFLPLNMAEGTTITLKAGCEFIVRSGAPICSANLIDQTAGATLHAGEEALINRLYIAMEDCSLSAPAITVTGTVTAGPLNVRSGAGTGYGVLGRLQEGSIVTVEGELNNWYMITSGGLAGYVAASYVKVNPATGSGPASLLIRGDHS